MDELRGWRIESCAGPQRGCAIGALPEDGLAADLDALFASRDFGGRLRALFGAPLRRRDEFRVAIAACPNACSRPQIADLGLIGAEEPRITNETCLQCLGCVHACAEGAVTHAGLVPIVDPARCVRCGACCRVCLSGTLQVGRRGWRVLVGGRLGRRPRLATELPELYSREGVLAAAACALECHLSGARRGERFGALLERAGDAFASCLRQSARQAAPEPLRRPAPLLRGPV